MRRLRLLFIASCTSILALVALATPASAEGGQLVDASGENGGGGLAFVLMVVMVVIIAASLFFMDRFARSRLREEDEAQQ
jgi:hypothetical protein